MFEIASVVPLELFGLTRLWVVSVSLLESAKIFSVILFGLLFSFDISKLFDSVSGWFST